MSLSRRHFIQGLGIQGLGLASLGLPQEIKAASGVPTSDLIPPLIPTLSGSVIDLAIDRQRVNLTGQSRWATTVNGSLPAPILRFKEGNTVTVRVTNRLSEPSSIHWHGLLVPSAMDGVPGISFRGIAPHSTFSYCFTLKQSGTYWYHSHSGFQEQTGLYGALVVEPREGEQVQADRDYALVLSDWTDDDPMDVLSKLKEDSSFDNYHLPSAREFGHDVQTYGFRQAVERRTMWNRTRMVPTDYSDLSRVTTYTYLMNGLPPRGNWTGLFKKGETVRLRLINASAHTIFDVRITGLELRVIGTDGGLVEPVTVDELRIGGGETYDVLVRPKEDAYTIFAQAIDRTGYCSGTLATQLGLRAPIPPLDPVEWLTMSDMMGDPNSGVTSHHAATEYAWATDMRVNMPRTTLNDPGINLRRAQRAGRRVLTYADLHSIGPARREQREPSREIELHLTGNMERYVWGFDGQTFAEAKPIHVRPNERVRVKLVNDTTMNHPIHLHGMWSDVRQPAGEFQARKHTVMVQPAQQVCFDLTGERGRWAWHCHLLYHMESGMFREMVVD